MHTEAMFLCLVSFFCYNELCYILIMADSTVQDFLYIFK